MTSPLLMKSHTLHQLAGQSRNESGWGHEVTGISSGIETLPDEASMYQTRVEPVSGTWQRRRVHVADVEVEGLLTILSGLGLGDGARPEAGQVEGEHAGCKPRHVSEPDPVGQGG